MGDSNERPANRIPVKVSVELGARLLRFRTGVRSCPRGLAADEAPQGNTLDTFAARTEISSAVIQNFMAPVADFAEVIRGSNCKWKSA